MIRLRGATIVLLACALVAGCGSARSSGSGPHRGFTFAAVAAGTLAARTAHIEGTVSSTGPDAERGTFRGDADFASQASDMKSSDVMDGERVHNEFLLIGNDTYLRTDDPAWGSSKYLKLPHDELFDGLGGDATLGITLVGLGVADPVAAVRRLRSFGGDVRDLGSERVRGIATTHLRLATTVGKIFACAPSTTTTTDDPARADDEGPCIGSTPRSHASVDVWVDGEARMVRLAAVFDLGSDGRVESRVDYSRFGAPVHITAPPTSQVVDEQAIEQELFDQTPQTTTTSARTGSP